MQAKIAIVAGIAAAVHQVAGLTIPKQDHQLMKKDDVIVTVPGPIVYVTEHFNAGSQPTPVPQPPVHVKEKTPTSDTKSKPSSSAVSTPSGSPGGSVRSKRGIAYNDATQANAFAANSKDCTWGYNWSGDRGGLDSSIDFIPTLEADKAANWNQGAQHTINLASKAVFSINEPDQNGGGGSNALVPTVGDAVRIHTEAMKPYIGKVPIGAPSVTNDMQSPVKGFHYLEQFVQQCTGDCHFDFFNLHWYSGSQYSSTLFDEISKVAALAPGKKIWVTEFKNNDGGADASFLKDVLPQLDSNADVEAYSYFQIENLIGNGVVNSLGELYAS